ncbi:MAG: hypothetical protein QUS14_01745, partial [Pyrinomonadaceae bacterium]|nr:hypothetical protein [Pyrinomonadaceae bacterium]
DRADSVDGLLLKWTDPKTLQISFRSARIFHYTNFADDIRSGQQVGRYDIKLVDTSSETLTTTDLELFYRGFHNEHANTHGS